MRRLLSERQRDDQQQQEVGGQDPRRTARVEGAEQIWRLAVVEQDSGDQEAGQDEEEIHATPGQVGEGPEVRRQISQERLDGLYDPVQEEHRQDRQPADAVELRQACSLAEEHHPLCLGH